MRPFVSRTLAAVSTAALLLGGCSAPPPRGHADASERDNRAAVVAEVQARFGKYDQTATQARTAGFDYLDLIARALNREPAALHSLFSLTHSVEFEAEAIDDHAEVLGTVLRDVGERFFAATLASEPEEVQNEVRQYVAWDFGYDSQAAFEYVRGLYPKLFPDPFVPADYDELPAGDEDLDPNAPEDGAPAETAWRA